MKTKLKLIAVLAFAVLTVSAGQSGMLSDLTFGGPARAATPALATINAGTTVTAAKATRTQTSRINQAYGKLPLSFEINKGQTDQRVRFLSRGHGYSLFLTGTEAVLSLKKSAASIATPQQKKLLPDADKVLCGPRPAEPTPAMLRMKLIDSNQQPRVEGVTRQSGISNYFRGSDKSQWHTRVRHFSKVLYNDVYRGIDLLYYGSQQKLEYDFIVAPGADPNRIHMSFEGAKTISISRKGELVLDTGHGKVLQHAPVVYQEIRGVRTPVAGRYELRGRQVGFRIGDYDRSWNLVIDPVLIYSTYLGGSGHDNSADIALDSDGNAYVTGRTSSTNFPTANALQSTLGGQDDAFVTKLNASGSALIYSTYLGGNSGSGGGYDAGHSIAVDSGGNAYITGRTTSTNFPTANALQSTLGGQDDAFVTKLNASGSALVYSTYLGGSGSDYGNGIAVDSSGNTYVTGRTDGTDFPTANALQSARAGNSDAFVTKVNTAGSALVYSTYLGGSTGTAGGNDGGRGIAVDSSGNAYVTGTTDATNFPTVNALQGALAGVNDAFVTKVNTAGSALVYSTYLGGSSGSGDGQENGQSIAVDNGGNAYVTGFTTSADFPNANALQSTLAGIRDAFVTKVNAAGSALVYSTYLGGTGEDSANAIAVDSGGNAHVTGYTASPDFPTANALQPRLTGDFNFEGFVFMISAGSRVPAITSVSPGSGRFGTSVTITGSNFYSITSVKFNGVSAAFILNSPTHITATVPADASTGPISVTNIDGIGTSASNFLVIPTIGGFTSATGPVGTSVTISGTAFTDTTAVKFNGVDANYTIGSHTQITAIVPALATTGPITVTNPYGTGAAATPFLVTPTITSFTPVLGPEGASVTITGTTFSGTTAVKFNGVNANYTIDSNTQVTAIVPASATTGAISLTNAGGTITSSTNFTVTPAVSGFTPASGPSGTSVTITGTSLGGANEVRFGGVSATFTINTVNQITASVPANALSGPITVTTPTGTATSADSFQVAPTVLSFAPDSGVVGSAITIHGVNFTGATSVRFNGVSASFTLDSPAQITAVVPASATTGAISVTNSGGTSVSVNNFRVLPTISGFTPTNGPPGSSVAITGTSFTGTTEVRFNGIGAGYSIESSTQITAVVPSGATTGPISLANAGGITTSTSSFVVDPARLALSIAPAATLNEGATATVTITRNTSTSGPLTVALDSSNDNLLQVPTIIEIPAGLAAASFLVTAINDSVANDPVAPANPVVQLTASVNTMSPVTASVTIVDNDTPQLSLAISPLRFKEGTIALGMVRRNTRTTGPLTVHLSSSNLASASPSSDVVTLAAGSDSSVFLLTAVDDSVARGLQSAIISASASGFGTETAAVTIEENDPDMLFVTVTPATFSEVDGANIAQGTVTRNTATTAALTVELRSSDLSEATVAVPSIVIPAGASSATFFINAVDDSEDDGARPVTISASASGFVSGTAALSVIDNDTSILALSIASARFSEAGGSAATRGTIRRNTSTTSAMTIFLSSSNVDKARVPASVTIAAGATTATFPIAAVNNTRQDGSRTALITAQAVVGATTVRTQQVMTVIDDDVLIANTFSIRGRIANSAGTAVAGVTVRLFNGSALADVATTGATGSYSFSGLLGNMTYTVTPVPRDHLFMPLSRSIAIAAASQFNINFVATPKRYTISGRIVNSAGVGVGAVTVTRSGSTNAAITDASGNYRFTDATSGTYTLTPSRTSYRFVAPRRTVTVGASAPATAVNFIGFSAAAPQNIAFTPASGPVGATITITGRNFSGAGIGGLRVAFSGATSGVTTAVTVLNSDRLLVKVPAGAVSGPIRVSTSAGSQTSVASFKVTTAPMITSFTPNRGVVGTVVTITGFNFSGATGVTFNGVAAKFSVLSATQIRAVVPAAAGFSPLGAGSVSGTGPITVKTPVGMAQSRGIFETVRND